MRRFVRGGALIFWSLGLLEFWSVGALVCWSLGDDADAGIIFQADDAGDRRLCSHRGERDTCGRRPPHRAGLLAIQSADPGALHAVWVRRPRCRARPAENT